VGRARVFLPHSDADQNSTREFGDAKKGNRNKLRRVWRTDHTTERKTFVDHLGIIEKKGKSVWKLVYIELAASGAALCVQGGAAQKTEAQVQRETEEVKDQTKKKGTSN